MRRFETLDVAIEAAVTVTRLLDPLPPRHRDLADQGRRAVQSVPLNIAEANGREGRDRAQHLRIAYGSSLEATAVLRIAEALGVTPRAGTDEALALLDRVQAMTWRLLH